MKKLLLVLLGIFLYIGARADVVYEFRTVGFASRFYNEQMQYWDDWSDVEPSDMRLIINDTYNIVIIYSPQIQTYKITEHMNNFYDADGDYNMVYKFIDQDGDRGTMKLLMRANGQSEIYIMFNNVKWCYIVERKY